MKRYGLTFLILAISAILTGGCSLAGGGTPDEQSLPVVRIADGIGSAPYREGVFINLQAAISNADGAISRVEFTIDDRTISQIDAPNPEGLVQFVVTEQWQADGTGARLLRVSAVRDDGVSGEASVMLNVVAADSAPSDTGQPTTVSTSAPAIPATISPPVTLPPPTTAPASPAPPTASTGGGTPEAVFNRLQNVRSGPGLNFSRVGTFSSGDRTPILAVNPGGDWFKVRFGSGEAWVFAPYVDVTGNISNLPRESGPPTPVPQPTAIPTAPPPTVAPDPQLPNLTVTDIGIFVPSDGSSQPRCGVPFVARVTVRNTSDVPTSTGLTLIQNVHVASGTVNGSSGLSLIPVDIGAQGSHTVEYTFTIDTFVNEEQRVEFIADANNEVAESNENDNRNGITYVLQSGEC
ncbi:MAG: hypothetical protein EA396_02970 [Anaerolineaceae bacterium]|nr:MAG: hypothetical protein EA396_02970 [Anaerolineaceae bacterium]